MNPIAAPYLVLGIVASCALCFGLGTIRGGSTVRAEWKAAELKRTADAAQNETASAKQSVKVVTEYVDRIVEVERSVPVVRDRVIRVCDQATDHRPGVSGGAGSPDAAAATDAANRRADQLGADLIACKQIKTQCHALIEWKRGNGG